MNLLESLQNIFEGASVEDEYNRNYSSIDKTVFETIAKADPKSRVVDGELQGIGFGAKSLLLRCYLNGDTDFMDNLDNITKALTDFYANQGTYSPQFKNLNNFPSIQDFLNFMESPEDFSLEIDSQEAKATGIDNIYSKYYSSIDRKDFDDLVTTDPETTDKGIGYVMKNLILPKYLKGETEIIDHLDDLREAIETFYKIKDTLTQEEQKIESYKSIKDFVNYMLNGTTSKFIKNLENNSRVDRDDWEIVASNFEYDVVWCKSKEANIAITHDNSSRQDGYLKWCTGWRNNNQWSNYSGSNYIYCFLYKRDVRDRLNNYQLALNKRDSSLYRFLDGNDEAEGVFNAGVEEGSRLFKAFLIRNLSLAKKLAAVPHLSENGILRGVLASIKYQNKALVCSGNFNELESLKIDGAGEFIKEVSIENISSIPTGMFMNFLALQKVTLKEGLKKIGHQAFMYCKSLKEISFPESLEEIGAEAFAEDSQLPKSLRIPNNVVKIGREAFRGTHCKLTIDRGRTKKLKIDPADKDWFLTHHRAINVQEDLDEDFLKENIPPDLVKAYRNSTMSRSGSTRNPQTDHAELISPVRRGVRYNYGKANYTEISKEEAKRIGKYEKEKVSDLRFILGNKLIEFELRNNKPFQTYVANIPTRNLEAAGIQLYDKDGYTTSDSRYASYNQIVDLADKIYQTDEYQHYINDQTDSDTYIYQDVVADDGEVLGKEPVKQKLQAKRSQNQGRAVINYYNVEDILPHRPAETYGRGRTTEFTNFDTGSHNPGNVYVGWESTTGAQNFLDKITQNRLAYRKWDNSRRQLKKLQRDRDLYDEKSFEEEEDYLKMLEKSAYQDYLKARKALNAARDKVSLTINQDIQDIHKRIYNKLRQLQDKLDKIQALTKSQNTLRLKKISYDSDKAKEIQDKITTQEKVIRDKRAELEGLQREIDELTRKITELQTKLSSGNENLQIYLQQISTLLATLDDLSEGEMKKKFEEIDSLEREKEKIEKELDQLFPSRKKTSSEITTEVDSDLEDVIDFSGDDDSTDSEE